MRIDSHHHLWRYRKSEFGWIAPESEIARDFDVAALARAMKEAGVDAAIAVQARQTVEETKTLLRAADGANPIIGVVGWVDLRAPDIATRLDDLSASRIVGYRHVVQDEADPEFLLDAAFLNGVRELARRNLTYDLLVGHHQLHSVPRFLERAGQGRFVLDHAAKPRIRAGDWRLWADQIKAIAAHPNVDCKVSGLITEADPKTWTPEQIEPYLEHLLRNFGPDRLIWGSDWPVCLLAAPYRTSLSLVESFVERNCPQARAAVFHGNAMRAYALEKQPRPDCQSPEREGVS